MGLSRSRWDHFQRSVTLKKSLLNVIFASEKRKEVLLLLQDGAKEMEYILSAMNTTRQALLPQMKLLEEHYLVSHYQDTYELAAIGKLTVDKMAPLVNTFESFDTDIDYWGTHALDFLPSYILKKINKLRFCNIIKPQLAGMYDLDSTINASCEISQSVSLIAASFHPSYLTLFSEIIHKGTNVNAVFFKNVLDKLQKSHSTFLEEMIKSKSFNVYVYPKELGFLSLVVNDYCILMRLLKNSGEIDGQYILCSDPDAVMWGRELFDYYLRESEPITEI